MAIYKGDKCIAGAGKRPDIKIDPSTKHWLVDGEDTGVHAEGTTDADKITLNHSGNSVEEEIKNIKKDMSSLGSSRNKQRQVGKATLWYHTLSDYGNTDDEAAHVLASNEIVVAGGALYGASGDKNREINIIKKAKELNPNFKIFYYITIASWRKDGDWSHILGKGGYWDQEEADKHSGAVRIHTKWEIFQLLEYAAHAGGTKTGEREFIETYTWTDDDGVEHTEDKYIDLYEGGISFDGCFYDDAGMETNEGRVNQGFPESLREKYIQLVDYTHSKGLAAFPNQLSEDWYTDQVTTANPEGKPSSIGPNDYMLLESTHTQVGFQGRPLWRHVNGTNSVYNYYQNWYPKVGAKVVVNDYLFGTGGGDKLNDEEFYELATYLLCDTLCSGAHYLDMNGLLTWEVPDFFKKILIPQDENYDIQCVSTGRYILRANGHKLEVVRSDKLTAGETVTSKTLKKVFIYLDDQRINNIFKPESQYFYETDQRLDTIESNITEITTSAKATASIYHRMMIDDWNKKLVLTNFGATFTKKIAETVTNNKIATVERIDYETNGIRIVRLNNTQVNEYVEVDITNKKGHTLEIGFTINPETCSYDWGFNAYEPAPIGWTYLTTSVITSQNSAYYEGTFTGFIKRVTIPEDTEDEVWKCRICFNGNAGKAFEFDKFYVVDVDEYEEDVTKDWYTNGIPKISSAINNNDLPIYYILNIIDDYDFDITWTNSTNWAGLRWIISDGTFIPGHTYEFGFKTYENNAGSANVSYRIFTPSGERWVPKTSTFKSTIYNETRYGIRFTVPESATGSGGYCTLTNTSGNCQTASGDYYKTSIRGMYLYDVDEEGIVIRGEEPSNSYLKFCRVTEEKIETDRKFVENAMYVSDKGNMFFTDFNGNKVDVNTNGSIDESQLLPVLDENTSDGYMLKSVDKKWVASKLEMNDLLSLLKNNLSLESDGEYIHLKFGTEELSQIESGNPNVVYCRGLKIDQEDQSLNIEDDGDHILSVTLTPTNTTQKTNWSSSNINVIKISANGSYEIIGGGITTITASCGSYKDSITITITNPYLKFNIGKSAGWLTSKALSKNSARAFTYNGENLPSYMTDASCSYGIPLINGKTYKLSLNADIASNCYYGLQIHSTEKVIEDPGWKLAGTDTEYTPDADSLYLYVNFKYGSAGNTAITDEVLENLKNGFSVKIIDNE